MLLDDTKITGNEFKVRPSFSIDSKPLGGNTSGTGAADQGVKPAKLRVTFIVPNTELDYLKTLVKLAKAKDDNGAAVIYTITDDIAESFGIKQCYFCGEFSAPPAGELEAWSIGFTLKEYNSESEKIELSKVNETSVTSQAPTVAGPVKIELSGMERILELLEKKLSQ